MTLFRTEHSWQSGCGLGLDGRQVLLAWQQRIDEVSPETADETETYEASDKRAARRECGIATVKPGSNHPRHQHDRKQT
jgi:hypothetical protein